LYKRDYHKFIEYNVKDVELVDRLENKMKLIEMAVALAYSAKVNLGDVFSQVRMWDSLCYHHLRKKNIVIPPRKHTDKDVQFEGAYVKEPQVGIHNWVVSFDLNSLYPHLMMQYNLSPEKLITEDKVNEDLVQSLKRGPWDTIASYDKIIEKEFDTSLLKRDDLTVTPNIMFFKRDSQGFFPEILEDLYNKRKSSKKKMLECQQLAEGTTGEERQKYLNLISKHNNDQLARKVQLNSAYGALGNQYFRFYDLRIAEAVTKAGQLSIRWIESKMNKYLNTLLGTDDADYILAADTDSIYVNLDPLVKVVFGGGVEKAEAKMVVEFLDKACSEKLEPYIDKCYDELADYMNAYAQKMVMGREVIASKGLWTAKKRYVLNVYNNEGVSYSEPKLKVMGLEAVKSSTPEVCRQKIKDALSIIMNGEESDAHAFIEEFKNEFYSLPAEDVAFPRGVNGVRKYTDGDTYIKHTPIHVKGSIIYNRLIMENKLDKQYHRIMDGDKIKFLYLIMPNPSYDSVISIPNNLPKEFGLNDYVDYDKQFVKAFLDPIKVLLDCVGWNPEQTNSLERFFG
jgi:DNA polymerase elongation subunit (family B)